MESGPSRRCGEEGVLKRRDLVGDDGVGSTGDGGEREAEEEEEEEEEKT